MISPGIRGVFQPRSPDEKELWERIYTVDKLNQLQTNGAFTSWKFRMFFTAQNCGSRTYDRENAYIRIWGKLLRGSKSEKGNGK